MRVVVAGAGFAGLLAAYRVALAGHEVAAPSSCWMHATTSGLP
jgi:uncharacterized protein with NAD-binding domain and iron-sulfur cluster